MKHAIEAYLGELNATARALALNAIQTAAEIIFRAYQHNKQIFIMGNGGSAANASHLACDLSKGTLKRVYDKTEKRLHVVSLTDNVPVLTAFANDCSYEEVFSQQLHNLVDTDDVVIAITGARTIGLLGFDGGTLKGLVDHAVIVPSNNYGVIEDLHSVIGHILTNCLAQLKKNET